MEFKQLLVDLGQRIGFGQNFIEHARLFVVVQGERALSWLPDRDADSAIRNCRRNDNLDPLPAGQCAGQDRFCRADGLFGEGRRSGGKAVQVREGERVDLFDLPALIGFYEKLLGPVDAQLNNIWPVEVVLNRSQEGSKPRWGLPGRVSIEHGSTSFSGGIRSKNQGLGPP